eukprot:1158188-Pelagomonas_calceolata.AAC.8
MLLGRATGLTGLYLWKGFKHTLNQQVPEIVISRHTWDTLNKVAMAEHRLDVLSRQLTAAAYSPLQRTGTRGEEALAPFRPAPGGGKGTLTVVDNRSGKRYALNISEGGTLNASELKQIKAGGDGVGLRVYDPGWKRMSTWRSLDVASSHDGEKGILRYRGYPIEELAEKGHFLEVAHCVLYGDLPTKEQMDKFQTGRWTDCPIDRQRIFLGAIKLTFELWNLVTHLLEPAARREFSTIDPG